MLLKITLDPDPGYAVKEVFYTYNANSNDLFALFPKYPNNGKLLLKDLQLPGGTTVSFLSTKEKVNWKQVGTDIEIELPAYDPNKIKNAAAYAIKISNVGKFSSKTNIKIEYQKGSFQPTINLAAKNNEAVHYTLDGSEPTVSSAIYTKPFTLDKSATVKAAAFMTDVLPGVTSSKQATRYEWMNAVNVSSPTAGIAYQYFEPAGKLNLESIGSSKVVKTGITSEISDKVKLRVEKFALSFDGFIKINKAGLYNFSTFSDDGSKLFIDDIEIVNNDGEHAAMELAGKAALKKGYHTIKVIYFRNGDINELKVNWHMEGRINETIPASVLFH